MCRVVGPLTDVDTILAGPCLLQRIESTQNEPESLLVPGRDCCLSPSEEEPLQTAVLEALDHGIRV